MAKYDSYYVSEAKEFDIKISREYREIKKLVHENYYSTRKYRVGYESVTFPDRLEEKAKELENAKTVEIEHKDYGTYYKLYGLNKARDRILVYVMQEDDEVQKELEISLSSTIEEFYPVLNPEFNRTFEVFKISVREPILGFKDLRLIVGIENGEVKYRALIGNSREIKRVSSSEIELDSDKIRRRKKLEIIETI